MTTTQNERMQAHEPYSSINDEPPRAPSMLVRGRHR